MYHSIKTPPSSKAGTECQCSLRSQQTFQLICSYLFSTKYLMFRLYLYHYLTIDREYVFLLLSSFIICIQSIVDSVQLQSFSLIPTLISIYCYITVINAHTRSFVSTMMSHIHTHIFVQQAVGVGQYWIHRHKWQQSELTIPGKIIACRRNLFTLQTP